MASNMPMEIHSVYEKWALIRAGLGIDIFLQVYHPSSFLSNSATMLELTLIAEITTLSYVYSYSVSVSTTNFK